MSPEERERSYEHYKQWQINKIRYKHECVAYVLMIGVIALFVLKYLKELSIGFMVIIAVGCIYLLAMLIRKYIKIQQKAVEMKKIAEEVGGTDIVIDHEKGKVSFSVPAENADAVISDIEKNMGNSKYKLKVSRVQNPDKEMKDKKTTDVGYVNKNSQRNNGKTEHKGTDNNQWFYSMECLKCGHKYFANGSDIKIRKCPNCQRIMKDYHSL